MEVKGFIPSKLGDLHFSVVEDEDTSFKNAASNYPLENGATVTDFVQNQPTTLDIEGVIVGDDAADRYQVLRRYALQKPALKFTGRVIMTNAVIIKFSRNANSEIANGFSFDITLQEMKYAKSEIVTIDVRNLKIPDIEKPKTKEKKKKGKKSKSATTQNKVDNTKLNARIKELTGYGTTKKKSSTGGTR